MIGIDLGSRQVKLIQMQKGTVSRREMRDTIGFYRQYGRMHDGQLQIDLEEPVGAGMKSLPPDTGKWLYLLPVPVRYRDPGPCPGSGIPEPKTIIYPGRYWRSGFQSDPGM